MDSSYAYFVATDRRTKVISGKHEHITDSLPITKVYKRKRVRTGTGVKVVWGHIRGESIIGRNVGE